MWTTERKSRTYKNTVIFAKANPGGFGAFKDELKTYLALKEIESEMKANEEDGFANWSEGDERGGGIELDSWNVNLLSEHACVPYMLLEFSRFWRWRISIGPTPTHFYLFVPSNRWALALDIYDHIIGYLALFLIFATSNYVNREDKSIHYLIM